MTAKVRKTWKEMLTQVVVGPSVAPSFVYSSHQPESAFEKNLDSELLTQVVRKLNQKEDTTQVFSYLQFEFGKRSLGHLWNLSKEDDPAAMVTGLVNTFMTFVQVVKAVKDDSSDDEE